MIRKLLYLPTKAQKTIIAADVEPIMGACNKIASQEWKDQKDAKEIRNQIRK